MYVEFLGKSYYNIRPCCRDNRLNLYKFSKLVFTSVNRCFRSVRVNINDKSKVLHYFPLPLTFVVFIAHIIINMRLINIHNTQPYNASLYRFDKYSISSFCACKKIYDIRF